MSTMTLGMRVRVAGVEGAVVWKGCCRIGIWRALTRGHWLNPSEKAAFRDAARAQRERIRGESSGAGVIVRMDDGSWVAPGLEDLQIP